MWGVPLRSPRTRPRSLGAGRHRRPSGWRHKEALPPMARAGNSLEYATRCARCRASAAVDLAGITPQDALRTGSLRARATGC